MAVKPDSGQQPWCPFCGHNVARPSDAEQRKMTEFPVGSCDCGAVYVSEATGHNVGAAIVECLVYACGDEWDLAWELVPGDDYLTGRIENYDEITHRVIDKENIDGRLASGVLYFVRLHRDASEIAERFKMKQTEEMGRFANDPRKGVSIPDIEPEPDKKRQKQKASKQQVKKLTEEGDTDSLVSLAFDDKRTLRFMQRLLYTPDKEMMYRVAWILGQVCARVATRDPAMVADLLHRLFESCHDSASSPWGLVEAIGSIIGGRPDIFGAFTRHLVPFMGDVATQEATLWAMGEIALARPDLVRKTPFFSMFQFLGHDSPVLRGLMVRLLGRIRAKEAMFQIMALQKDESLIKICEMGRIVEVRVADLATSAVALINEER